MTERDYIIKRRTIYSIARLESARNFLLGGSRETVRVKLRRAGDRLALEMIEDEIANQREILREYREQLVEETIAVLRG